MSSLRHLAYVASTGSFTELVTIDDGLEIDSVDFCLLDIKRLGVDSLFFSFVVSSSESFCASSWTFDVSFLLDDCLFVSFSFLALNLSHFMPVKSILKEII